MAKKRGEINHRNRAKQINSFTQFIIGDKGTITPTDIDGFIEYQGECFIFIEVKLKGTPLQRGQRVAFARLVKAISKPAIVIISYHEVENTEQDVIVATTIVKETFFNRTGKWVSHEGRGTTTKKLVDTFIETYGG